MPHIRAALFADLILTLFILLHLLPLSSAYYTVFLREVGPEWFMSFNYLLTGTNLHTRDPSPTVCHEVAISHKGDSVTAIGLYNPPTEIPVSALAVYPFKTPKCGKLTNMGAAIIPGKPAFVIVLDPNDLYGLHVVDIEKLGLKWFRGSIQPLNITAEQEDPRGLLYGLPKHRGSGLYVWEGIPSDVKPYKEPKWRIYLPNTVDKVVEPTNILRVKTTADSDRTGYLYMRDLIERHLRPEMRGLKETIAPWILENNAGTYEDMKAKPIMSGPLYGQNNEDWSVRGGWLTKDDNDPLRRSNQEAREKGGKKGEQFGPELGKGWTLVYTGPEKGSVLGMEYYDLNSPRPLNPDSLPSIVDRNGDDIINDGSPEDNSKEVYGPGLGERPRGAPSRDSDSGGGVYVHISDEAEDEPVVNQADASRSLYRMKRLHRDPKDTMIMEEGDWDEKGKGDEEWDVEDSSDDDEQLIPVSDPGAIEDIRDPQADTGSQFQDPPPGMLLESEEREPQPGETKQEEGVEEPSAIISDLSQGPASPVNFGDMIGLPNLNAFGGNQPPVANVMTEELRALVGTQMPNIYDPAVAVRAQQIQAMNRNNGVSSFNPFRFSSTVRERPSMSDIDTEIVDTIPRWSSTSTRDREGQNPAASRGHRQSHAFEGFEDYEDPQERNPRNRARDAP
ncbi:hypothetical protein TWF730_011118 [Orbilia blumenaviensis]|uniref:Uncharacterized protein n=1 Tax=Orbilia blumenaviensis TaxID=1796055 RepID=A0AAV9UKY3_9PEZI